MGERMQNKRSHSALAVMRRKIQLYSDALSFAEELVRDGIPLDLIVRRIVDLRGLDRRRARHVAESAQALVDYVPSDELINSVPRCVEWVGIGDTG